MSLRKFSTFIFLETEFKSSSCHPEWLTSMIRDFNSGFFFQQNVFTNMWQPTISMLHNVLFLLFTTDYSSSYGSGAVILDDCNFHESVHIDSFDIDRTLTLVSMFFYKSVAFLHFVLSKPFPTTFSQIPSDGEFSVMNYWMYLSAMKPLAKQWNV